MTEYSPEEWRLLDDAVCAWSKARIDDGLSESDSDTKIHETLHAFRAVAGDGDPTQVLAKLGRTDPAVVRAFRLDLRMNRTTQPYQKLDPAFINRARVVGFAG